MIHRYLYITLFYLLCGGLFAQGPGSFGELIHSADLGSLTPTPDRHIVGIQYAEGFLWATGFDPDDYWQHKLYKYSADGSELLEYFSYGIEAAGWKDLAYDGEYLYVTDMDTIRQLNMENGEKTGVTIPAPFYYNAGLAYNPFNDHFYVTGDGGSNIYEIDRDGEIIGAIDDYANHATVGLAVDTLSPGGPFLWTWSSESIGYNLQLKASQVSLVTHLFTGIEFEGESISPIIQETAGGATIAYDYVADSVTFIVVNLRNGNANDQMEYAMYYDITRNDIPGPQITVDPLNIQNTLAPGDSIDVEVNIFNDGDAPLYWSAYIETPDQDTANTLGELTGSFNATQLSMNEDKGMNGITFLNGKLYVNGRNYGSDQSMIYAFDKEGTLLSTHPYYTISSLGYRTLATDGEYLYGEDTYSILQINPENFSVAGYILKPSSSFSGLTYDPQTDHFWGGNGVGLILEFDRDGNTVNEFITSYDIQGLAWDNWSPGGPFLWAWVETQPAAGAAAEAIRLDPATCTPTGVSFQASNFSAGSSSADLPKAAVITNAWEENKTTFLGLQNTTLIVGSDTLADHDVVAAYDLDVTPPPAWIALADTSFGTVEAGSSTQFHVRLRSIMDDTVMTAVVRIDNNDILNPQVVIPVNFEMTAVFTAAEEYDASRKEIMGQNFPNPATSQTHIPVTLETDERIRIRLLDLSGRFVKTIYQGRPGTGTHTFTVPVQDLEAGVYLYTFESRSQIITRRMILNK